MSKNKPTDDTTKIIKAPEDTPSEPQVIPEVVPVADPLATIMARLEVLEADKNKLTAENESLKADIISGKVPASVEEEIAKIASRGFSRQFQDVHENIHPADHDTVHRKPKDIQEVTVEVNKLIGDKLVPSQHTRLIKQW